MAAEIATATSVPSPAPSPSSTPAAAAAPLLDVQAIDQYYGGSHILRGLSLQARAGEVTVVLGRNGVGKTTLLKCLMGVVPVKRGSIRLGGTDLTHATSYDRVRERMAI